MLYFGHWVGVLLFDKTHVFFVLFCFVLFFCFFFSGIGTISTKVDVLYCYLIV